MGDSAGPADHFANTVCIEKRLRVHCSYFCQDNYQQPADDDLGDLSDRAPDVFSITLPEESSFSSYHQEQRAHRNLLFPPSAPHQHSGSTDHENDPKPVHSYPQTVFGDAGADKLLVDVVHVALALKYSIYSTFGCNQTPASKGEYRRSGTQLHYQAEVAGYQSASETSAQPLPFSWGRDDRGFSHSGGKDATSVQSHAARVKVSATEDSSEDSGGLLADTASDQLAGDPEALPGRSLLRHDLLRDLGDEFYGHTDGGLGSLSVHQPLVDNLSPGSMTIDSLLSYYGNSDSPEGIGNSSANGSPPLVCLQREDPMELSNVSVNAVRSFHLYEYY